MKGFLPVFIHLLLYAKYMPKVGTSRIYIKIPVSSLPVEWFANTACTHVFTKVYPIKWDFGRVAIHIGHRKPHLTICGL